MVKRVLMIAFHFPPMFGSSGLQRTLKFCKYLTDYGWEAVVLTVSPIAYWARNPDQLGEIGQDTRVIRAWTIDAARHLSVRGRYPSIFARPDRWANWWLSGVPTGLAAILRYRPRVIWSTYPIATAHCIGATLSRLSGLPWVADFRDMMVDDGYPADARIRAWHQRIESRAVNLASRVVLTAPGTLELYARRYPELNPDKWAIIPNGYDETNFAVAEGLAAGHESDGNIRLVHSGILYPSERDPTAFFDALKSLKATHGQLAGRLQVTLRATGHDDFHRKLIHSRGIEDIVQLRQGISYNKALAEMLQADGLLLFQASNCNNQIPAKLYEYVRTGNPVLALTDPEGDTAGAVTEIGGGLIARIDDPSDIRDALIRLATSIDAGNFVAPEKHVVEKFSRYAQTGELARILDSSAQTVN